MTSGQRLEKIEQMAVQDEAYGKMLVGIRRLEKQLNEAVSNLPVDQSDIIWDYIMICEEMSHYVLHLACLNMIFPEEIM